MTARALSERRIHGNSPGPAPANTPFMGVAPIYEAAPRLADADAKPTGKVKKAMEYGIPVRTKESFEQEFYIAQ